MVLTWKTIEHLIFRHRILKPAYPVTSMDILAIWDKVLAEAKMEPSKLQLVISPSVRTPLSIGLLKRTTRVVLPEKDYTTEELELILQHKIVHIAREDAGAKYFLVFCTAMCWFNPLMWVAMRKSAEDIELSCDEAAFHKYLSGLTLSELTGYYSFSEYDTKFSCLMNTPEGTQVVQLYDNVISITKLYGETPGRYYYYIEDGTDWEYLRDIVLLFN